MPSTLNPAVFLDRDGVINEDRDDYVKRVDELKVFSFVPAAIRRVNDAGFEVIVVSNQQGVARGLISEADLQAIQAEIARLVDEAGGRIAGFYYCRHLSSEHCPCRKPRPGMLLKAAEEHGLDLSRSVMIGDSEKDAVAGREAGCKTVLVLTGSLTARGAAEIDCKPDYVAQDLREASEYVVNLVGNTRPTA